MGVSTPTSSTSRGLVTGTPSSRGVSASVGQSPKVGWSSEAWSRDSTKITAQSFKDPSSKGDHLGCFSLELEVSSPSMVADCLLIYAVNAAVGLNISSSSVSSPSITPVQSTKHSNPALALFVYRALISLFLADWGAECGP